MYIMDKEVKKFLLKYVEDIDEEVYFNFIKSFSKLPINLIKKNEMSVYLKCKLFAKKNKLSSKLFRYRPL